MSIKLKRRGLNLGNLSSLKGVLQEWRKLNENPIWNEFDSKPWWYNERAVLSLFVGAVWRQPASWAFEEFSTWRYQTRNLGRKGRADIWFSINDQNFVGEAKQCWPTLSGNALTVRKSVENTLDIASREVAEVVERDYDEVGLAMAFVAPCIVESKLSHLGSYLTDAINEVEKIANVAVAWTFPEYAEKMRLPKEHRMYRYIYPGTWLFLRAIEPRH